MEVPVDIVSSVKLNDVGLEAAIYAANDATHAGMEPYEQLERGIKAYIAVVGAGAITFLSARPPEPVVNPSEGWVERYAEWYDWVFGR